MEQKGLDLNFFIGMFLILGIIMWINVSQVQNNLDTSTKQNEKIENKLTVESNQINKIEEKKTDARKTLPSVIYNLSNEFLSIDFSNYGASINQVELKDFKTYNNKPLIIAKDLIFDFSFFIKDEIINCSQLFFSDVDKQKNKISFTYIDNYDNSVVFVYELKPNSYSLDFNVLTKNGNTYIEPNKLTVIQNIQQQEKNLKNERNNTTINYSVNSSSSKQLSLMKDATKSIENPSWVAHKQQFFSTIINSNNFRQVSINTSTPEHNNYVKRLTSQFDIEFDNNKSSYFFNIMFIPNKYSLLSTFDSGYESLVPLGKFVFGWVNKYLVIPMFNFLEKMNLNYGIIILIIAFVIKLLLFIPTRSSYISMAKMRVLKPEIDAINEKISDPLQKQQAQMNLYRKTGVNPLGGCLPLLFQMPILIALFRFFPASIELRQQPFLWADDLSTYDSILDFGFSIPLYGDHISLFALLMTGATLLQMIYSNQLSGSSQMPQMKYVMYTMPVVFLFVMNNYSAALSYYYFLANLITFAQQAIIRRGIDDEKLYALLQANKKKPVKKSKFQQKLEEIAKQNKKK